MVGNEDLTVGASDSMAGAWKAEVLEPATPTAAAPAKVRLTAREIDVLRLMAEGLTTKAIAEQLKVRFKTAVCHRGRVLQKLGVHTTVSAVRWAIRNGVVEP